MICIDKLVEDIPQSCSRERLRGYTGKVKLYDYRGYTQNKISYSQSVTLEVDPYSILPIGLPEVRPDNVTVYRHSCEFKLENEDTSIIKTLTRYTQIPVVIRCELVNGKWIEVFSNTGGKLLLQNDLTQGEGMSKNLIKFQHFDKTALEEYPPMEKDMVVTYIDPIVSLSLSPSKIYEIGETQAITLTPGFTQNDAGSIDSVVFKLGSTILQTQSDLTPFVYNGVAVRGVQTFSVEISYLDGPIKVNDAGVPVPEGQILAGTKIASKSVEAAYRNWYGAFGATPPTNGTELRTLNYSYEDAFTLNTGTTSLNWVIAVPRSKAPSSIIDLDAIGLDIINSYLKSDTILTVPDGAGVDVDYNVYILTTTLPYSSSHRQVVSLVDIPVDIYDTVVHFNDSFETNNWSVDIRYYDPVKGENVGVPNPSQLINAISGLTAINNPNRVILDFDYMISAATLSTCIFRVTYGSTQLFSVTPYRNYIRIFIPDMGYFVYTYDIDTNWHSIKVVIDLDLMTLTVYRDSLVVMTESITQVFADSLAVIDSLYLFTVGTASPYISLDNIKLTSDTLI